MFRKPHTLLSCMYANVNYLLANLAEPNVMHTYQVIIDKPVCSSAPSHELACMECHLHWQGCDVVCINNQAD